jgi:putative ABC transport system permease protein
MLATYLKLGYRSLLREKSYSLINIAGLSIGVACCLILGLYLNNELSYDLHHENHERVYRLVNEYSFAGNSSNSATTSRQAGRLMAEQYDEIIDFARFVPTQTSRYLMGVADASYYWEDVYSANNGVFKLFTHEVIYGDPETALVEPESMAVSETFASRYFGDANPIGEFIETDNGVFRIDLVFADLPDNSHLKYDALLSYEHIGDPDPAIVAQQLWGLDIYNYFMFNESYDIANFNQLSEQFYEEQMAPIARQGNLDITYFTFSLEPLADIHLWSTTTTQDLPRGNPLYLYAFAVIAALVLLVACINYMNLATARSTKRAKEVGMRKVIGASKSQLVAQFIGESVLYVMVSLLFALTITNFIINFTNISQLLDSDLRVELLFSATGIAILALSALLIGVLSGLYPAFYLSSITPMSAFKGTSRKGGSGRKMRETLVVVQFIISIAVIGSTLFMLTQMNFVQTMQLGFDKEDKILVRVQGAAQIERLSALQNELMQLDEVKAVAMTNQVPGDRISLQGVRVEGEDGAFNDITANRMGVGFNFANVLDINVIAGRDFDESREFDRRQSLLVNQAFVAAMGWDEPIGKQIYDMGFSREPYQVIGVLEDFHYAGLQQEVVPVYLSAYQPNLSELPEQRRKIYSEQMIIAVDGSVAAVTDFLRQRWVTFDPEHPFEFTLLENLLDRLYGSEQRLMQLIGVFSAVCIFISCLGLYGLSAFNTAQRTKEIGIRKVLGASDSSIILILYQKILLLVIVASIVASMISFWAVSEWLKGFHYRIDILGSNSSIFLLAAVLAIAISFTTIALQAYRTARSSPIKALRYE